MLSGEGGLVGLRCRPTINQTHTKEERWEMQQKEAGDFTCATRQQTKAKIHVSFWPSSSHSRWWECC